MIRNGWLRCSWLLASVLAAHPLPSRAQVGPTHEETTAWLRRTLDRHAILVNKEVTNRYWMEEYSGCELKIGNRWNSRKSITQIPLNEVSGKSIYVTELEGPRFATIGFESPKEGAFLTRNEGGTTSARHDFTIVVDRHDVAHRIAQALRHLVDTCGGSVEPF